MLTGPSCYPLILAFLGDNLMTAPQYQYIPVNYIGVDRDENKQVKF
jgi:hypothetical protein